MILIPTIPFGIWLVLYVFAYFLEKEDEPFDC